MLPRSRMVTRKRISIHGSLSVAVQRGAFRWNAVLTRSLGPSSIPSLGNGVMLGTAWIDRPVDLPLNLPRHKMRAVAMGASRRGLCHDRCHPLQRIA